ncbi:MAG: nitrous oxide reductase accessory protein NosL [Deferrisomatales bacterium]|nr:nitrous oxide reductase accessory protein NosL [Deferrisomatales bacterium]
MGRWCFAMMVVAVLLCSVPQALGAEPELPPPGPKDRCPVCGMFVAPYPDWTAAARFPDGTLAYFDGPKDMFRYAFAVGKFDPARRDQKVESLWVTEYYTATRMPAAELFFVAGSDVLGPMGHELVPIRGEEGARTFQVDHHGKQVLPFAEITPAVVSALP